MITRDRLKWHQRLKRNLHDLIKIFEHNELQELEVRKMSR